MKLIIIKKRLYLKKYIGKLFYIMKLFKNFILSTAIDTIIIFQMKINRICINRAYALINFWSAD